MYNPISDRNPVAMFDTASEADREADDGDAEPTDGSPDDLIYEEATLGERLTPNTKWGWLGAFVAVAILVTALSYFWPLIPPFFKSTGFLVGMLFLGSHAANFLLTRQQMLSYWQQFDHIAEFRGSSVVPITGKVVDRSGENPLIKKLDSVGFAGLNPRYETVDDVTRADQALMAKLDRRNRDGSWGPARILLDHAYTGRGEHPLLGDWFVVHSSGHETTEQAPGWEARTQPPKQPDMDAARRLMSRDEQLRNDVIPALFSRLETRNDQKEWMREAATGTNLFTMDEMQSLLRQSQHRQQTTAAATPGGNGHVPAEPTTDPQQALESVDERTADEMEENQ